VIIERFLANTSEVSPDFAAKLWIATSLVCRWQHKQFRDSGESYLDHLFDAAFQIYEMGLGEEFVIAEIMHDIYEDTKINPKEISDLFGDSVLANIMAVSKNRDIKDRDARVAEWEARWKVACDEKWQRIFMKISDVLHNLLTLHGLFGDPEKRRRVAVYTLNFYIPYLKGEAREIVPKEYHHKLDSYITKLSNYALAQLTLDNPA